MTMTPEQLREEAAAIERMHGETLTVEWRLHMAELLRAHAAALEEIERIKANRDFWMESCKAAQGHRDGANAQIALLEQEVERLKKENDTLRGLLGNSAKPCPYCGLPAEDQAKCPSGFPGCARADDQMLSKHFADAYRAEKAERRAERLKFHAEAMAHYTDCYKDKWPDSGARQTLDEYRAEFKEGEK